MSRIVATGGDTIQTINGQKIHTFTTTGTATFTVTSGYATAQVLVVGGGGGGGYDRAAGGGAGGVVYLSSYQLAPGTYTVTVGGGGAGSTSWNGVLGTGANNGSNGQTSYFGIVSATGGGGGGTYAAGNAGGSGGGGHGQTPYAGGAATPGQGNAGGQGGAGGASDNSGGGGGAGGVGAAGGSGTNPAGSGNGGVGLQYSISGTATYYGGGGGGSVSFDSFSGTSGNGLGGLGGGGNSGQTRGANGSNGTANTGGGGGGGANIPQGSGGTGGSGIVIISYADVAAEKIYYSAPTTLVNSQTNATVSATISLDKTDTGAYLTPSTSNAAVIQQWIQRTVNSYSLPGPNVAGNPSDTGTNAFVLSTYKTGSGISNSTSSPFTDGTTGSLFLNGTAGSYSITSTSLVFNWWTTQFTLECWVNYTAYNSSGTPTLFGNMTSSTAAANYWSFGAYSTGILGFYYYNGTGNYVSTSTIVPTGVWTSIAVSCDATNIYLFINGVLSKTTAVSGTPQVSTSLPFQFCQGLSANLPTVSVANIRYTSGVALYTSTYTPSMRPLGTSPSGTTVLLVNVPVTGSTVQPFWSNLVQYGVVTGPSQAADKFVGGCLVPDGRVVMAPWNAAYMGIFSPATNTYTSIATAGTGSAINQYQGGVLSPDGRVIFVPQNASAVGIFNPASTTWTTATPLDATTGKFSGGCVASNGLIYFYPNNVSYGGVFNPVTSTYSTTLNGTFPVSPANYYIGGCLHPNGNIYLAPYNGTPIGIWNPVAGTYTTFSSTGISANGATFNGAVVLPDGRVAFIPRGNNPATLGIYNPATNIWSTIVGPAGGNQYFVNGCLLPDGRVFCAPANATFGLIFNPVAGTYTTFSGLPGGNASNGAYVIPDGRVVGIPCSTTTGVQIYFGGNRPVPREFCLHPFFNRY